jgi:lysozyme
MSAASAMMAAFKAAEGSEGAEVPPAPAVKPLIQPHGGPTARAMMSALTVEDDVTPEGKAQLKIDEGLRLAVYKDTKGIDTVGYGFNLEEPANAEAFKQVTGMDVVQARAGAKITQEQADALLDITVKTAEKDARKIVQGFDDHEPAVQDAITNFVFNLGLPKAAEFKNTLAAINRGDGKAAANGIRRSRYYQQVGARGERVAKAIEAIGSK